MGEPTINFEGKEYSPDSRGYYRCPYRCGNPDFPAPKWVTERGFAKHLAECRAKPEPESVYVPPEPSEVVWWRDCDGCGRPIMTGDTIWVATPDRFCFDCAPGVPTFGYFDCAGLVLPGVDILE